MGYFDHNKKSTVLNKRSFSTTRSLNIPHEWIPDFGDDNPKKLPQLVYRWIEVERGEYTFAVWTRDAMTTAANKTEAWTWYYKYGSRNSVFKQNVNFKPWPGYKDEVNGLSNMEGPPSIAENIQAGIINHTQTVSEAVNTLSSTNASDTATIVGTTGTTGYALLSGSSGGGISGSTSGGVSGGISGSNLGSISNSNNNSKTIENLNTKTILFIIFSLITIGISFFLALNLFFPVLGYNLSTLKVVILL